MRGRIVAVFGNLVVAECEGPVMQNAVARCHRADGAQLLSEVIRVHDNRADLQVFEETRGLKVGDPVEVSTDLLSVQLGPGLLGQIFDGLQNPLPELAERHGYFLPTGGSTPGLREDRVWQFEPAGRVGDVMQAGDTLGYVPEGIFKHHIMVPFGWRGRFTVQYIAYAGKRQADEVIAEMTDESGATRNVTMLQRWPVKVPLNVSRERLLPSSPLVTRVRMIDSLLPVMRGGTYCIPGPFGAGKTVLQQITSRNADVDVVVVAACGERAGEVVETIQEFPRLSDPRTGRSLMERTVIVCNTSAMPVAAREASVYTAVTLGEYYRQMGLHVLLLADSTSRWAQAMRELSGRLEEIPGEEAFPAYLESRIAAFYERAGAVRLRTGHVGTLTIGGTVSPAGGNFEEPVTQATLKVVGAFHGLSTARAHARRYPAIDPLDSWSRYAGIIEAKKVAQVQRLLRRGNEIRQMTAVVGEEGVSVHDYATMLKAEFVDAAYLQQNAFDDVDGSTNAERQELVFDRLLAVLDMELEVTEKEQARAVMVKFTDLFRNWNYVAMGTPEFEAMAGEINDLVALGGRDPVLEDVA
ncbi:MAG: V-type ATP synthase subunit A [Gemmatimonadetes bacterium]|nr:V-type ATP synthase subunit A [Gemmatimonadota bacterium]